MKIPVRGESDCPSMPSGDTSAAASFCFIYNYCLHIPFIYIILPFVMLGRVYYHNHYIGDCIVGAIIGLGCGFVIVYWFNVWAPLFEFIAGPDLMIYS